jgi:ppGpp synthetase/RelA/SpoT-type nucleotidyltranferase
MAPTPFRLFVCEYRNMDRPPECPWSKNKLKKLGKCIRDSQNPPPGVPGYDDVMLWYAELAAFVTEYMVACDWTSLLVDRPPEIVSRVKTIDTLRDKLRRDPSFPLPEIQDVVGVRFEADMSLIEQDAVVQAIVGYFADIGGDPKVTDYRESGGHSGYRAVHVVIQLTGKVEIQVRTHTQGRWANTYEAMADVYGRAIRYDQLPEDPRIRDKVLQFQDVSLLYVKKQEEMRAKLEASSGEDMNNLAPLGWRPDRPMTAEQAEAFDNLLVTAHELREARRQLRASNDKMEDLLLDMFRDMESELRAQRGGVA